MGKIIEHRHDLETIHHLVIDHLKRGVRIARHPFREMVLSTSDRDGHIGIRRLICRKAESAPFKLTAFTDHRSAKISDLQKNKLAALHFWHPSSRLQVNIHAAAELHYQDDISNKEWKNVNGNAQASYNTALAPGTELSTDLWSEAELREPADSTYFVVMAFHVKRMEVLQLNRQGHMRCTFSYNEGLLSESKFIVP